MRRFFAYAMDHILTSLFEIEFQSHEDGEEFGCWSSLEVS